MNEQQLRDHERLPQSEACRLIDFEEVDVVTLESFPPQEVLVVSGTKPYLNMEVSVRPRTCIRQPEYWGIDVAGRAGAERVMGTARGQGREATP